MELLSPATRAYYSASASQARNEEHLARMLATESRFALLATPIKPAPMAAAVWNDSSSFEEERARVYFASQARVAADVVAERARMLAFGSKLATPIEPVVIPSGLSTSIFSGSPMSTSDSPAKLPCGIGGADDVLPAGEVLPHQAELAIVAELSSVTTKFQLVFNEALSRLDACTSHSEVKSGFAGLAIKALWSVVSTFQNAWFPKKPKKKLQAVGDTLTGGMSHQSGTPDMTGGVDAVLPACNAAPAVSVGVATRRKVHQKRRQSNAVPFVTKGPASDIRHGTIVGVNHERGFAFIRTSRNTTDFYVGQRQFHYGMAIGDEVSFCELKPHGRRRRCPEACRVDLLARAWSWYHRPYGARKRATGL